MAESSDQKQRPLLGLKFEVKQAGFRKYQMASSKCWPFKSSPGWNS